MLTWSKMPDPRFPQAPSLLSEGGRFRITKRCEPGYMGYTLFEGDDAIITAKRLKDAKLAAEHIEEGGDEAVPLEVEVQESEDLVLPHTGEVVELASPVEVVRAIDELNLMASRIAEAKRLLSGALVDHWRVAGEAKTFAISGRKVEIRGGVERSYDAQAVMDGLRALGMPEERIKEIVVETVEHKVKAVEAKRAAAANENYKAVIDAATTEREVPFHASLK